MASTHQVHGVPLALHLIDDLLLNIVLANILCAELQMLSQLSVTKIHDDRHLVILRQLVGRGAHAPLEKGLLHASNSSRPPGVSWLLVVDDALQQRALGPTRVGLVAPLELAIRRPQLDFHDQRTTPPRPLNSCDPDERHELGHPFGELALLPSVGRSRPLISVMCSPPCRPRSSCSAA